MTALTPARRAVVAFLALRPASAQYVLDAVCPRRRGWTAQGASRFLGGLAKPLLDASLVRRARPDGFAYEYDATDAGRDLLALDPLCLSFRCGHPSARHGPGGCAACACPYDAAASKDWRSVLDRPPA